VSVLPFYIKMYSLKSHNSFGFDIACKRYREFGSEAELVRILSESELADSPLLVIGSGSNILFTRDFPGTVLHSAIKGISPQRDGDTVRLSCSSGETMDSVIDYAVSHGFHGLENLSLIPGEVGAAAVQNIGAYGVEAKDVIESLRACDIRTGETAIIAAADCHFGYRDSRFKHEWAGRFVITEVTFRLSATFDPRLDYGNLRSFLAENGITSPSPRQLRDAICRIRRQKLPDPREQGNAGSFFMNPVVSGDVFESIKNDYPSVPHYDAGEGMVKIPAAWLIEQSGWKGRSLGRAAVHDRQALVIVNKGGASPNEVINLYHAVQDSVKEKFGISLHPEVIMV